MHESGVRIIFDDILNRLHAEAATDDNRDDLADSAKFLIGLDTAHHRHYQIQQDYIDLTASLAVDFKRFAAV